MDENLMAEEVDNTLHFKGRQTVATVFHTLFHKQFGNSLCQQCQLFKTFTTNDYTATQRHRLWLFKKDFRFKL